MKASDQAMSDLCEVLAAEIGSSGDFDVELGELVGKYRRRHDQAMRDAEAARLLPLGAEVVAERLCCHRVTVYRRAKRARKIVASNFPGATQSA